MALKKYLAVGGAMVFALQTADAQTASPDADLLKDALQQIQRLASQVAAQEARIRELEAGRSPRAREPATNVTPAPTPATAPEPAILAPEPITQPTPEPSTASADMGGHNMAIPGGPVSNIRGFFDFNFGVGSIANPLIFPTVSNGCAACGNPPTPAHNSFQAGELDLFLSSKLSNHLSFISEIVFGSDTTNFFGIDIERYQLTYRANRYFSASVGRFHTSIGYYNTAYHHGNWFSTADGRPIMYLFEDSGGALPVHMVGVSLTGAVPGAEKLGLHWVAEMGNGRNSSPASAQPVQNFYSDRNYKAVNLAVYIKPELVPGLQIGGSFYHDKLAPPGLDRVNQNIGSAYVVYFNSEWEFLTEGVLLSNRLERTSQLFQSPMAYTQVARKFAIYKPYFRYQYLNDRYNDPVNILQGKYYGPSVGMRIDFAEYAAFKLQYTHLYQSRQLAGNGLDAQVAFTF